MLIYYNLTEWKILLQYQLMEIYTNCGPMSASANESIFIFFFPFIHGSRIQISFVVVLSALIGLFIFTLTYFKQSCLAPIDMLI